MSGQAAVVAAEYKIRGNKFNRHPGHVITGVVKVVGQAGGNQESAVSVECVGVIVDVGSGSAAQQPLKLPVWMLVAGHRAPALPVQALAKKGAPCRRCQ